MVPLFEFRLDGLNYFFLQFGFRKGFSMLKAKLRAVIFSVLISAGAASAGLEPASVSGYSAFTNAKVALVITDENGYMGVLLS